jgi:hypothetical protein
MMMRCVRIQDRAMIHYSKEDLEEEEVWKDDGVPSQGIGCGLRRMFPLKHEPLGLSGCNFAAAGRLDLEEMVRRSILADSQRVS